MMEVVVAIVGDLNIVSNMVMAVCAVTTVIYTIRNNSNLIKKSRELESSRLISAKYDEICYERCIKAWDNFYLMLSNNLNEIERCSEECEIKRFYDCIDDEYKRFDNMLKVLEYFNKEKYRKCSELSETIPDIIADCIKSISQTKGANINRVFINKCKRKVMNVGKEICGILFEYGCKEIWHINLN